MGLLCQSRFGKITFGIVSFGKSSWHPFFTILIIAAMCQQKCLFELLSFTQIPPRVKFIHDMLSKRAQYILNIDHQNKIKFKQNKFNWRIKIKGFRHWIHFNYCKNEQLLSFTQMPPGVKVIDDRLWKKSRKYSK